MKKLLSLCMILICIVMTLVGSAGADGSTWTCPTCGEERNTDWCPICGNPRTAGGESWVCLVCGRSIPGEYGFCPDDGSQRPESTGAWPVRNMDGVNTSLKPLNSPDARHQSYIGPNGGNYDGAGAYKPAKVTSAKALFREGDYVLVDMSYRTVGRRCVYFKASSLTNAHVDEANLTAYPAVTTESVQAFYGPGTMYNSVVKKVKNARNETIHEEVWLSAGTSIDVFFEANGWVFAEFYSTVGLTRAWLPVSSIRAN